MSSLAVLALITVELAARGARAEPPPDPKPVPVSPSRMRSPGSPIAADDLARAVSRYVSGNSVLHSRSDYCESFDFRDTRNSIFLKLVPGEIHRDRVVRTAGGRFVVGADFAELDPQYDFATKEAPRTVATYNLDFWLEGPDASNLAVRRITLRAIDGKPRYDWIEEAGAWKRQPRAGAGEVVDPDGGDGETVAAPKHASAAPATHGHLQTAQSHSQSSPIPLGLHATSSGPESSSNSSQAWAGGSMPAGRTLRVEKRLAPPRTADDVDAIQLPLPRSGTGAVPRAARPLSISSPDGKPAGSVVLSYHANSETSFTWGFCAVYVQAGDQPPEYLGRLAASSGRTRDPTEELRSPRPFTTVLLYPLDCSGSFLQSSLTLRWVCFK